MARDCSRTKVWTCVREADWATNHTGRVERTASAFDLRRSVTDSGATASRLVEFYGHAQLASAARRPVSPAAMGKLGPDFDDFVRQSATPLLRTAVLLVGDRAHAEDLVQIALIRTAGRWSSAKQAPHAYARRVLVNLAKDTWRNRSRRPETPTSTSTLPEPPTRGSTENILDRDEVVRALALLSAQQRAVLVLRFLEDLPVAEVARILDCPEGTVRSHAHRGLGHLRAALSSTHPELNDPEDTHATR